MKFKQVVSLLGAYKLYEKWLWRQIRSGARPEHIAIILDGNRRWASGKELNPWYGHKKGADKVEQLIDWCLELDVKSTTLYALSTENFSRPGEEVEEILRIIGERLRKILTDKRVHDNRVRVKVIGRINLLPQRLQDLISEVEDATKDYGDHYLNFAFAYGGRAEIIDAVRQIAKKVQIGEISPDNVDEASFESYLYTSYMPKQDPDLIIRTSGEERLSGFLLWQSAYSELVFVDVFWPDFRLIDLLRAVRTFQHRKRRFGS